MASIPSNVSASSTIDALVVLLKTIHEQRPSDVAESRQRDAAAAPDAARQQQSSDSGRLSADGASTQAERFKRMVQSGGAIHDATGGNIPRTNAYEKTFQQFYAFQKQLTKQKAAMDHLLESAFNQPKAALPPAPVFQQTIYLQCPRHGGATGFFRCINRTSSCVSVSFSEPLLVNGTNAEAAASITLDPRSAGLEPAEDTVFQVTADLSESWEITADRLLVLVDVLMDGELTAKLWVSIVLLDE